jgi:PAS domain S-box-containing protein
MAQAELEQFRAAFFEAADAMLILDDRRAILAANPAACSLFGVPIDAVTGLSLDDLVGDEVEALGGRWRALLAAGEAKHEHQVRASGGARFVECRYRARIHGDSHLCLARDIMDRRLLEERAARSKRIEGVGRFAGDIAHDFNNLLTAILGYAELLLSSRHADDPDRADLEEIQRAGQRAAALTRQLPAFSLKQVMGPKDVDLNQTVAGLQAMLERLIREDIALTCALAPMPAVVRIDPVQIEQVVLDLVLNARDALPSGGQIRLEVARVGRPDSEPGRDNGPALMSDYVRLRVIDNGVRLPQEARAQLFEPFLTTRWIEKGTGLGLASVDGIVSQSDGSITVDSAPGKGTAFTMHFPAVQPLGAADVPSPAACADSRGRETILLVEDEDSVRRITSAVLRRQGYHVIEASTPVAACELFDEHREIDLLLTEVVMPGMNGPALAQRLTRQRPALRVLFISGYAETTIPAGGDTPNISILSKPFEPSVLTDCVRQLLDGGPFVQL